MLPLDRLASRLDELLAPFRPALGGRYAGYRNHACRVAAFHCLLAGVRGEASHGMLVAAAYHDLGIWTAGTFDYIPPSMQLAADHLAATGWAQLQEEVAAMIRDHHKLKPCAPEMPPSAELFRRADWMDVTCGVLRFGLAGRDIERIRRRFPGAGFHRMLLRTSARWLVRHPFNPLPMVRW